MATTDYSKTVSIAPLFVETKLKVALASLLVMGVLAVTGSALFGLLALLGWMVWGLFMYVARMKDVVISLVVDTFLPKSEDYLREENRSIWKDVLTYDYPMYLFLPALMGKKVSLRFIGPYVGHHNIDVVVDKDTVTVDLRGV